MASRLVNSTTYEPMDSHASGWIRAPSDPDLSSHPRESKRRHVRKWFDNALIPLRGPMSSLRISKPRRQRRNTYDGGSRPDSPPSSAGSIKSHRSAPEQIWYKSKDVVSSMSRAVANMFAESYMDEVVGADTNDTPTTSPRGQHSAHGTDSFHVLNAPANLDDDEAGDTTKIATPNLLSWDRVEYNQTEPYWFVDATSKIWKQIYLVIMKGKGKWWGMLALIFVAFVPATLLFFPVLIFLNCLWHIVKVIRASVPGSREGKQQLHWMYEYAMARWHEFKQGTDRLRGLLVTGVLLLLKHKRHEHRLQQR